MKAGVFIGAQQDGVMLRWKQIDAALILLLLNWIFFLPDYGSLQQLPTI